MKLIKLATTLAICWPLAAFSGTIEVGFNDYISPTDNQLARDFVQTSFLGANPNLYLQVPIGGTTGGSVTGYTGDNYGATAIYQPAALDFSSSTASTSLSLDFYFNGKFTPLGPGANAVRSFRLGLVGDPNGSFESTGNPAIYIDGIYSFDLGQMLLVGRSVTVGMTSSTLAHATLSSNSWNRISVGFTNSGSGNIHWDTTLWSIGTSGDSTPSLLAQGEWNFQNTSIASDSSTNAGFSALTAGGVTKVDNLTMTNFTVSTVPTPPASILMLAGLGLLGLTKRFRKAVKVA